MIDPNPLAHAWSWIEVHTGAADPRGGAAYYNWWSGFGSDIGEVTLITGLVLAWRHINCHTKGCWRLAKHPVDGTPYKVCKKCHPQVPDKVTRDHIHKMHLAHEVRAATVPTIVMEAPKPPAQRPPRKAPAKKAPAKKKVSP